MPRSSIFIESRFVGPSVGEPAAEPAAEFRAQKRERFGRPSLAELRKLTRTYAKLANAGCVRDGHAEFFEAVASLRESGTAESSRLAFDRLRRMVAAESRDRRGWLRCEVMFPAAVVPRRRGRTAARRPSIG